MSNVSAEQCETHRDALYGDISKKASTKASMWFGGLLVVVLLSLGGVLLAMSVTQGVCAGDVKVNAKALEDQKARDATGQKYRETARTEQKAWQARVDEKLDDIKHSIYTHTHEGNPTP